MNYLLNRKSLERLKALVRAGKFDADTKWAFSAADSNALLDDPPNWPEYQQWFLGIGVGVPTDGTLEPTGHAWQKSDFAFPFGKGQLVSLDALRQIAANIPPAAPADIVKAAGDALADANKQIADRKSATGTASACDRDIRFTAPATIRAAAAAGQLPTFHAVCYTGVAMAIEGFSYPVVIDYDGVDFTAHSRPALRDHDPKRPVGHTTRLAIANGNIEADGEFSVVSPDAQEVVESGRRKFPWQISVGAKVLKSQFVPAGESAAVNGNAFEGPVIVARQTSLREISFLSLGADDNTSARIAARAAKKGAGMPALKKKFAAWAKARNITLADMEDDGMASAAKALYKAQMKCEADDASDEDHKEEPNPEPKEGKSNATAPNLQASAAGAGATAAANPGAPTVNANTIVQEMRAAAVAEHKRIASINQTLDEYRPHVEAAKFAEIQAKAIGGEYDPTRTELELLRAKRPTGAPNINTGAGAGLSGNILAAAACVAHGMDQKFAFKGLDERSANIAASARMSHASLHGIMSTIAPLLGLHARAGQIDRDFVDEFLLLDKQHHRKELRAARANGDFIKASSGTGFATMSLTGILENILNKMMLEQYSLQGSVVGDIAWERDATDFKPFKSYRLTASGDLQPIGPGGEIKTMSLQDESYSNQVTTKAALIPTKREDIENDDMGALTQLAQVCGRKGALNREKAVFSTFLSGLTTVAPGASVGKTANAFNMFSAGAKNYLSGAGSALSIASLTTAAAKFIQQTDANGDPIMLAPDRVLCCPEVYDTAKALYSGASIVVGALGSTAAKSLDPNYNVHAGSYRPIRSPFLGGASPLTGASATQWALLGNPAGGMAPVQVGYLRGQRTPIIRQVEVDANMLGLAYQVIYDFGVALHDYRTVVYSAGA